MALFSIATTNEIVVDSASGGRTVYKNAPGTQRDGLEFAWEQRFAHGFEAYASFTKLRAEFTQDFVSGGLPVAAGSRLAGVPDRTAYGELVWRHTASGFHAAGEVRHAGRIQVNDRNTESNDAYTVGSVRVGFEQRGRQWRLTEFLRVDNVADRHYVGSVIVADSNGRFYEPAPGRNWLVGVSGSMKF